MEKKQGLIVLSLVMLVSLTLTAFALVRFAPNNSVNAADPPPIGLAKATVTGWLTRAEFISSSSMYKVTVLTCDNKTLYYTQKNMNDTTKKYDFPHYTGPMTAKYVVATKAITEWTVNDMPACDSGQCTWVYGRVLSYVDIPALMTPTMPMTTASVRIAVCKSSDKSVLSGIKTYTDFKNAEQLGEKKALSTYKDCGYFCIAKNANGSEYIKRWLAWLGDCCDECNWVSFEITSSSKKVITGQLFNTVEYTVNGKLCGANGQTTYKTFKMKDIDGFKPVDNSGKYSLPGYTGCTRICLMPNGTTFYKWRAYPDEMPCCAGECSWTGINITSMSYHQSADMGDSNYWIIKAKKCTNGTAGAEIAYRLYGDMSKKDIKNVQLTKTYKGCARACISGTTIMYIELQPNKQSPCCQ